MTTDEQYASFSLDADLETNKKRIIALYRDCPDVIYRDWLIFNKAPGFLLYHEGLTDTNQIHEHVLSPLMKENDAMRTNSEIDIVKQQIRITQIVNVESIGDVIESISTGKAVLLIEGENKGLAIGVQKWEKRKTDEPKGETVIRGPREGFVESLSDNVAMLRKQIKVPALKFKPFTIGRITRTQVWAAYIDGISNPDLIQVVSERLRKIETNDMLESGNIEELIKDNPYTPFPLLRATERPDIAVSGLLEGRVAIITEGTPFVLVAPATLPSLLHAADDYYKSFLYMTAIRWLRYVFLAISLLGPSIYVAITSFHQEMIPTSLYLTIARTREEVPFPVVVEALLMEVIFEALREAGIRLPRQAGSAVSIVGGLVIGEAAINAGLVSPPVVMIVGITGIASFMMPNQAAGLAFQVIRFPILILSGFLGLLGVILGLLLLLAHLCRLNSFGVPYLAPVAPMIPSDMNDVLIRAPFWMHDERSGTKIHDLSSRERQDAGQDDPRRKDP